MHETTTDTESAGTYGLPARRVFLALVGAAGAALLVRRDGGHAARPTDDLAAAEARQAAARAALCSAANAAGVGLRGEYFAAERCAGTPLLVRLDPGIDFDATFDLPAGAPPHQRPRSVRWSGWVKPPLSGRYRFHAGASDTRIVVARQVLSGTGAAPDVELAAGRFHPILVEVDRIAADEMHVRLEWTAPHGARFLVPRALLYLPTEGLVPSRTA